MGTYDKYNINICINYWFSDLVLLGLEEALSLCTTDCCECCTGFMICWTQPRTRRSSFQKKRPRLQQLDNSFPHAGRIRHFLSQWRSITQDQLILEAVQGYNLPFRKVPPDTKIRPMKFSQQERTAITGEILSLLDKKVIHLAESQGGFVSNIFTVPKSSGKVWLILKLKSLNTFLEYEHFMMEDIWCIISCAS